MIYPIRAFGDPVLRAECADIVDFDDDLKKFIEDMFETMDGSDGVGLAAPQIGKSLRVFVIDSTLFDKENKGEGIRRAFINPIIEEEDGEEWVFEEGCLSIPEVREDVKRKPNVILSYQDIDGKEYEERFDGMTARVIQHEYDHIEGVLFTDYISTLKKQLLKGKLANISKGKVNVHYRMKFPKKK